MRSGFVPHAPDLEELGLPLCDLAASTIRWHLHRWDNLAGVQRGFAMPVRAGDLMALAYLRLITVDLAFRTASRWSAVDRLNTLDVPTLLLVGSHDAFTSPSQSYRIGNRLRRAELVEFAESGHMPWLDEPDRFFEVCSGWIRHLRL